MNKEELLKEVENLPNSEALSVSPLRLGYEYAIYDTLQLIKKLDSDEKNIDELFERGQQLLEIQAQRDKAEKELRELKCKQRTQVVVPDFVGEWYEEWKNDLTQGLFNLITAINYKLISDSSERMAEWIKDPENDAVNILAHMKNGYTVEEKKYRVVIGSYVLRKWNGSNKFQLIVKGNSKEYNLSGCKVELTEKEIKDVNPDFWPFAEEVASD